MNTGKKWNQVKSKLKYLRLISINGMVDHMTMREIGIRTGTGVLIILDILSTIIDGLWITQEKTTLGIQIEKLS